MATFYKRKATKGIRWTARVRLAQRHATKTFASKGAAERWARAQEAAHLRSEARGGRLDAAAVDAVLGVSGQRSTGPPAAPAGLTPREVEVLVLVARGGTTRHVARMLNITPKTAGNHIERIYTKIGASSRSTATLYAMQHGMLATLEPLEPPPLG